MSYTKNNIATIDIGSKDIKCIIAYKDDNDNIHVIGKGIVASNGVSCGKIINTNLAKNCIKDAISKAQADSGVKHIDHYIIGVNSVYLKCLKSKATIKVIDPRPSTKEIKTLLEMSASNLKLNQEYRILQVVPIYFKVDGEYYVQDPLGKACERLEASTYVIAIKQDDRDTLRKSLDFLYPHQVSYVSNVYANMLGVVKEEYYKSTNVIVDIGHDVSHITISKKDSLIYSSYIPLGSNNITKDLAISFKTVISAANMIKEQYGSLLPLQANTDISRIKLPIVGNETQSREISLEMVVPIIHARVEEILYLIKNNLTHSGFVEFMHKGNLFLTGGMSKLDGVFELSSKIFSDLSVQKTTTKTLNSPNVDTSDGALCVCVGLVLYQLSNSLIPQLTAEGNLRGGDFYLKKANGNSFVGSNATISNSTNSNTLFDTSDDLGLKNIQQSFEQNKEKKPSSLLKKLGDWL